MNIVRLSDEATQSFRAEAEPVYDDLSREVGGDLVARFRNAASIQ